MQKSLLPLSLIALSLLSSAAHSQTWQKMQSGIPNPTCFIGMATANIPAHCTIGNPVWSSFGSQTVVGAYAGFGAGKHLITTPQDSKSFPWGCHGTVTGATSTTNGEANTNTIIAASCPSSPNKAAQVCRDLGRSWYLPAQEELQVLFYNLASIGGIVSAYWSSTQHPSYSDEAAYIFGGSSWGAGTKSSSPHVRCVRGF